MVVNFFFLMMVFVFILLGWGSYIGNNDLVVFLRLCVVEFFSLGKVDKIFIYCI